jgi:hypothetical protein
LSLEAAVAEMTMQVVAEQVVIEVLFQAVHK